MLDRRQLLASIAVLGASSGLGRARIASGSVRADDAGAARLLRRAGFGARPGDLARVGEIGLDSWIDEQLSPGSIPDLGVRFRVRRLELPALAAPDLYLFPGKEVLESLRRASLLRAVYSERQLHERMVDLWSDHFSVAVTKGDVATLVAVQDREVIRPHALGRFGDLLRASLRSPALLTSLDGRTSTRRKPNENHARELLELHTLGVHGGYGQTDVMELARLLTGFTTRRGPFRRGTVTLRLRDHDTGSKVVLGAGYGGSAEADVDALVERLVAHPSTARHISERLCRRLVADPPPEALVTRAAAAFARSAGDIRATLDPILRSEEIRTAPARLSRPYDWLVAILRASSARTDGGRPVQEALAGLGQAPFGWPFPDGYPDAGPAWTASLLPRWNLALALSRGELRGTALPGLEPAMFLARALDRPLTREERGALALASDGADALALALCHPELLAC